jgi:hypothetical protein
MNISPERLAGLSGVLFVALFIAGSLLLDIPGHDDSDVVLNEFYADGAGRARVTVSAYLLSLAGLAFIGFLTPLCSRLEAAEGWPSQLARIAFGCGVMFAALVLLSGALQSPTYAVYVDLFNEPASELNRAVIPHLGYSALVYAFLPAALVAGLLSLLILRRRVFPAWLAWLGFLAAFLSLFGVLFLPLVGFFFWVLAMSLVLIRSNNRIGESPESG